MALCLFCNSELDGTTRSEHILLNALGGRKATSSAICSAHNNEFGGTIDNALTSQVMALRNLFGLESGRGNPAPTLKKVQAGRQKINIKGDGELELADKPFTIDDLGDGKYNVQIRARSEDHLTQIVPNLAAALKIPEESLRDQLSAAQASKISQRPGTVHFAPSFGGPDAIRSMVKASLILWSTLAGNDEIRGAQYAAARNFVINGDQVFNTKKTHLDSRAFDEIDRMKSEFGPLFNLIYVRSNDTGRVVGHFTLYNAVAWQFTLAEAGGTPNAKIALISNPLDPSTWSDNAAANFDVPFEWLNSPDYSDEMVRSKARFEAIIKHYFESGTKKVYAKIIEASLKQLGFRPGDLIPQERVGEVIKLAAMRLLYHARGLPFEEKLTPEQIGQIIQPK